MLARLFVFVGSIVVLLLTAALVGPYFINWTDYRAEFEAQASQILGRTVTVEGDASARLLPFPSVTFSDVRVAGAGGEPALTAETFSMDAELAPFMSGEFRIFDMRLVRPHMKVDVDAQGGIDWAMRPSTPIDPRQISVESLTITDGSVELIHAGSGRTHNITGLNAAVSARTLAGPWRASGTAELDGLTTALSISTGSFDPATGLRVKIDADPAAYPIALTLDGSIKFEDARPAYAGTLRLVSRELKPEQQGSAPIQTVAPAYRVNGKFSMDSERLQLSEYRFETGPVESPYTADGTAELTFDAKPRFSIRADGAQVRFDETVAGEQGTQGITLESRLNALERTVSALPRPTIPGTLDVNLPAVVVGDTTIRDVRLSAQPATEGWQLDTFAASLPGRTTLEGDGLLRAGQGDFGFSGNLILAVGQPSGFATWLSRDVNETIRALPAAGFSARVEMTRQRQRFSDLELRLGTAAFRGEIERRQQGDARPSMQVKLDGDSLDFDTLTAFASIFVSDDGQARLVDHDLDFDVKAGPVRAAGIEAEGLDTALRLRGNRIEVDRLAVTGLAGANISATGRIENFGTEPTGDIDASVVAVDLAPLLERAAARFPDIRLLSELSDRATAYPGLFADARLDLIGSAAREGDGPRGFAFSARGEAGGTSLQLAASSPDLSQPTADLPLRIELDAQNDDGGAILALTGAPVLPLGMLGHSEAMLKLDGTIAGGLQTTARLHGDAIDASFDGKVASGEAGLQVQGSTSLSAEDIEPWLMTTGLGLPTMGLGTPANLAGPVSLANGTLSATLEGSWSRTPISGGVTMVSRDGRPHFTGALSLESLDLVEAAGLVVGPTTLQPTSDGDWSRTPFANASLLPFTVDMRLKAGRIELGGNNVITDAGLALKLDNDGLKVADLAGSYAGGGISGLGSLQNSAGTALFQAQLDLRNADLAQFGGQQTLSGRGDVSVGVSASGKTVDGLVQALSGSGTIKLKELAIAGLDGDAFPKLIAAADQVGRSVDAQAVASFAPAIIRQADFRAGDADMAFTIASGALRIPTTRFETPAATLSTDFGLNTGDGALSGRAELAYAPGKQALIGSEPSVALVLGGTLDAPTVTVDTAALGQFLTQRALEIEQARVEAMQAALLERQRLRREVRYYAALAKQKADAEAAVQEEMRRREQAQAEAARQAVEEAARQADEEALRRAIEAGEQTPAPEGGPAQQAPAPAGENSQEALPDSAPRAQPAPQASPTPQPAPPVLVQPFQMPEANDPASGRLTPLPEGPASGGGGLPGVFDQNQSN